MNLLDKIILLLVVTIDILMITSFFYNFFKIRSIFQEKKKWCSLFFVIFLAYIANLIKSIHINLIIVFLIHFAYVIIIFDGKTASRLLYLFAAYLIIMSGEVFLIIIQEKFPQILIKSSFYDLLDMIWQIFAKKIFAFIIFEIIEQISIRGKKHMPWKMFFCYLCNLITNLIVIIVSFCLYKDIVIPEKFKFSIVAVCVIIVFSSLVTFYVFHQYIRQKAINVEQKVIIIRQKADVEYYKQIIMTEEKYKVYIHDMVHYIKIMEELAKENQQTKIMKLTKEIIGGIEDVTMPYSSNTVLNAILNEKKKMAEKLGINMDIYVEPRLHTGSIQDKDMITMVGNLLENAIEATSKCDGNLWLTIKIYMQKNGNFFVLKVTNPYTIQIVRKGTSFLSTKRDKNIHGVGIKSVEEAAKKYHGFLECKIENMIFSAMLILQIF